MGKLIDLTGQRFGHLTVIELKGFDKYHESMWMCVCTCGKVVVVRGSALRSGHTVSCGCYRIQILKQCHSNRLKRLDNHSKTRLFSIWQKMRFRCENPKDRHYQLYGGRGIKVCEEWNSWENFYKWAMESGYQEELTIDRIDNDGDYMPQNCRWVSMKVQNNNKRSNITLTYNGYTRTVAQWSVIMGIGASTLYARKKLGWSDEDILSIKPKYGNRKRNQ